MHVKLLLYKQHAQFCSASDVASSTCRSDRVRTVRSKATLHLAASRLSSWRREALLSAFLQKCFSVELHIYLAFRHYGRKPDLGGHWRLILQRFPRVPLARASVGSIQRSPVGWTGVRWLPSNLRATQRTSLALVSEHLQILRSPSPSQRHWRNRLLLKVGSSRGETAVRFGEA